MSVTYDSWDSAAPSYWDLQAQVNDLRRKMPKQADAADYAQTVAIQARLDDAYRVTCDCPAPAPLAGEGPTEYHSRILGDIAHRNRAWTPRAIDGLRNDARSLQACEPAAVNEARERALADIPDGDLKAVTRRLDSGHSSVEFYGKPFAWMAQFAGNTRLAHIQRPVFEGNEIKRDSAGQVVWAERPHWQAA
jgi:hypothetical protein